VVLNVPSSSFRRPSGSAGVHDVVMLSSGHLRLPALVQGDGSAPLPVMKSSQSLGEHGCRSRHTRDQIWPVKLLHYSSIFLYFKFVDVHQKTRLFEPIDSASVAIGRDTHSTISNRLLPLSSFIERRRRNL
jgi:hypothetical protein